VKYKELLKLIEVHQSPRDWKQIVLPDGSTSTYFVDDVLLRMDSRLVWVKSKPYLRFNLYYSSTLFGWFDLPLLKGSRTYGILRLLSHCRKALRPGR
jgi:hypothetical protein